MGPLFNAIALSSAASTPITVPTFAAQALSPGKESKSPSVIVPTASIDAPGPKTAQNPAPPAAKINPYNRDIDMVVPLERKGKSLGEVPVRLTRDSRVEIGAGRFNKLVMPLLNDAGRARLNGILTQKGLRSSDLADGGVNPWPHFLLSDLSGSGVDLSYDPYSLSLEINAIEPTLAATELLFTPPRDDDGEPDIQPASVSGFLNLNLLESRIWSGFDKGLRKPAFYLNGAIRAGSIVFEGDGQIAQRDSFLTTSSYRFDRNYARLVYDQPQAFRRFYLGDLTPETRGEQNFVQMGGVGVSRQRLRFDQFRSAILQGNRQLILQKDATVDVYRNGSLYQQFQLAPGSYDLSALPLTSGSNDVRVEVRDTSGVVQNLNFQSYLDPIDLEPGDYEYSAYIGRLGRRIGQSPVYNGELAFTGFYRKAFTQHPAIGVGVQLSNRVKQLTGQTQFILLGGSRLQLQGGVSKATNGMGYAGTLAFEKSLSKRDLSDSLSFQATYQSKRFAGLGDDIPNNSTAWSLTALYSRGLTRNLNVLLGGNFVQSRANFGRSYRIFARTAYRFSRAWRIQGGVSYANIASRGLVGGTLGTGGLGLSRGGLGFNIALTYQPSASDRAEIRHDSNLQSTEASYVHSGPNRIGGVGFGAIAGRDLGFANAQAFADYTGNRFDAFLTHSSFGSDFSNITSRQITSLRLGTSLVFADGQFGIGRRVNDSFALLYPHHNLKGHAVVAGQSLIKNDYLSKSGALGGAVNGYLGSYVMQSVQYDVENPPAGYDVGSGIVRVRPPYHSGYKLRIGTDAFVSAVGTLLEQNGAPASLDSGELIALDRKEAGQPFFTNTIGRFAVQNLRPGGHYRVELVGESGQFEFVVPRNSEGLTDLKQVRAKPLVRD